MHIPTLAELREQHDDSTTLGAAAATALDAHDAALRLIDTEAGTNALTASQQRAFDAHNRSRTELDAYVKEQRAAALAGSRASNGYTFDGTGAGRGPASAMRGRAESNVADMVRRGLMNGAAAERVTGLLEGRDGSQSAQVAAGWAATAGSDAYLRAFSKLLADPQRGHLEWTQDETDAYRAVQAWRRDTESRTALVDSGYVLPTSLDPAVMLTSAGSANPLRQLARVVTTTTSTWRGITSAGATAEWKTEGSQAADGTPAAAEVDILTFLADVDCVFSYEVQQDAVDLVNQLTTLARDAYDQIEAVAFATGNGTSAPGGLITGLTGTAVTGTGTEALAAGDPYKLQNALGARFSRDAVFVSHIATKNTFAQMETTNGALKFPGLQATPPTLAGKPWHEFSTMDGVINPVATENNYLLVYGDLGRAYVIVDRIGTTVEILPGFGANMRPTAQRHLFLTKRTGAKVVNASAALVLNVTTS